MTDLDNQTAPTRRPHAVLDLDSRRLKAIKIERLLDLPSRAQPMRMLEIGTGSGGIAHYFGTHPNLRIEVDAVDVVDNRLVGDGYRFQTVSGTDLPFVDNSFDIVLTNHVIEHVGDIDAQRRHLAEIRRVMKSDGVGYLAVPNRWQLVEPHYKLAFLSWWPHGWRSTYLRMFRDAKFYDCEPLTKAQVEQLLLEGGFTCKNLCVAALRCTLELEYPEDSYLRKFFEMTPNSMVDPLRWIIPTLIYRFRISRVDAA